MEAVLRAIFRAIHEGKWLEIEYHNKSEEDTKFWIGICGLDPLRRTLSVDALHLGSYQLAHYDKIYINSIHSAKLVEGSYCQINQELVEDIYKNPHKYNDLFHNTANLKILNYLENCYRMDGTPYREDFALIKYLDRDSLAGETYQLNGEQFKAIVNNFRMKSSDEKPKTGRLKIKSLAVNVLSINTEKGLYVLAYRSLFLDVKERTLVPNDEITVCTEFTVNGKIESARKFLDAEDFDLLNDFEANEETIKDCICRRFPGKSVVDDMPYVMGLGMDSPIDLRYEYESIADLYQSENPPVPLRAFFGDLVQRPIRRAAYPIVLIDRKINMDQLLAINTAMKYPLAYIQGPPGTGKTSTIINTIITAFFNDRTALFVSYNNHPIDGVCDKLSDMRYNGKRIPFPILRLGNWDKLLEATKTIQQLRAEVREIQIFEKTLDRNKEDRKERAKSLSAILKNYEDELELNERMETIDSLLAYRKKNVKSSLQTAGFEADLEGRQRNKITEQLEKIGDVTEESALALLDRDEEELKKYLYYTSARYIKKLEQPRYEDLRNILDVDDEDKRVEQFSHYLENKENLDKLQKVFPIIATTCISAHRLGEPEPVFDMVIMDEASQCNQAVGLVPIVRGKSLMLVGDPQQLSPVILLDASDNEKLKKRYRITDEYDYCKNSIYKTFLACDSVSDEILLHNHYRCHKNIIGFNNKKYYNSKLNILTQSDEQHPLSYVDVGNARTDVKNSSPAEARAVAEFAAKNREKSIGIITPFVNQKNLIEQELDRAGVRNVTCGTVHAFQGDEKDVILFSTAITNQTQEGTYAWLKNNKELINVATSRAREQLVLFSSKSNVDRLHGKDGDDDLYELIEYVRTKGESNVTAKETNSRALGIKPFSTETETAFLENLNHALENIWLTQNRYSIKKEVAIAQVFSDNDINNDLFYKGRFDFVIYAKEGQQELPMLAIELDGKEHYENDVVKERDRKKNEICDRHNLQLIRVENSYARRYNYIKDILLDYFKVAR
ncbi:MAG: AAA domain-containing protein [Clostridiales bacterium]|nr:AAA domain-containing protein [Clostridiales bacterium]